MHLGQKKKILFILLLFPIIWSLCTKSPVGTSIESEYQNVSSLQFLYDLTYQKEGKRENQQSILSAELDMIKKAKDFIVLDLFLYNDVYDKTQYQYPNTTQRITEALIAKKEENPDIDIIFISLHIQDHSYHISIIPSKIPTRMRKHTELCFRS